MKELKNNKIELEERKKESQNSCNEIENSNWKKKLKIWLFTFVTNGYSWVHKYAEELKKILEINNNVEKVDHLSVKWLSGKLPFEMDYIFTINKQTIKLNDLENSEEFKKLKEYDILHFISISENWNVKEVVWNDKGKYEEEINEKNNSNFWPFHWNHLYWWEKSWNENIKEYNSNKSENTGYKYEKNKYPCKLHQILDKLNYVVTIHTIENDSRLSLDTNSVVENAKWFIFTSEFNKNYLIKNKDLNLDLRYFVEKQNKEEIDKKLGILKLPYFFDADKLENNINKYKKQKENIIFNCSRMISYKKIIETIKLAKEMPEYKFIFYGKFTDEKGHYLYGIAGKTYIERIKKYIEENNLGEDRVELLNGKGDKYEYYKRAKFVIDLSYFKDKDRVQYTTLEAMEYGCIPIVHKNYTGKELREWENVIWVGREIRFEEFWKEKQEGDFDYKKIKKKIIKFSLLEDTPIIKNNIKLFLEEFNSKNTGDKFIEYYKNILAFNN